MGAAALFSTDDVTFVAAAAGDTPVAFETVAGVIVAILNAPQTPIASSTAPTTRPR